MSVNENAPGQQKGGRIVTIQNFQSQREDHKGENEVDRPHDQKT